jgi:hypothetical protein
MTRPTEMPDWVAILREFIGTPSAILTQGAFRMVLDCTNKILAGRTLEGGPQKPNSGPWRDRKARLGVSPNKPLVFEKVLSDPDMWEIRVGGSWQPMRTFIASAAVKRVAAGRSLSFYRGRGGEVIQVRIPSSRLDIALILEKGMNFHYKIPFGVSAEVAAQVKQVGDFLLRRFEQGDPVFRARFRGRF